MGRSILSIRKQFFSGHKDLNSLVHTVMCVTHIPFNYGVKAQTSGANADLWHRISHSPAGPPAGDTYFFSPRVAFPTVCTTVKAIFTIQQPRALSDVDSRHPPVLFSWYCIGPGLGNPTDTTTSGFKFLHRLGIMTLPGDLIPVPQTIEGAVAEVKEVFATSFIGFAVATTAYGICVVQVYLYYRGYPRDSVYLKFTVATLWILDTLSTIMVAHSLYTYFVTNFGNLAADAFIPWSFALENGLLTMVTITVQSFYAWQIWTVSMNPFVTAGILLLAVTSLGLGLFITVHLFRFPAVASLSAQSFQSISGPVQGTAAACDVAITTALIFYLRSRRRAGIRTTEEMIDTLILFAVCRGILTAITQIMFLVLNVAFPHRTLWQPFHQLVGKLYVNSILASLNVRRVLLGKGDPEISSRSGFSLSEEGTDSTRTMPLTFMSPKNEVVGTFNVHEEPAHHSDQESHRDSKAEILASNL
ncbi:hypothetical protein C8R43DRAFT_1234439 [Mycena crocata]|nr:hypothetical protein C8R43DRAFT_1234439 [Mycena crocata]